MRVLQIDSGREWRGGQNQARLLCRELTRAGIEQTLVTKRDSELARRAAADGTKVLEVPWGWGLDPRAWFQLHRAVSDFKPDILHAHDSHALWPIVRPRRRVPSQEHADGRAEQSGDPRGLRDRCDLRA